MQTLLTWYSWLAKAVAVRCQRRVGSVGRSAQSLVGLYSYAYRHEACRFVFAGVSVRCLVVITFLIET